MIENILIDIKTMEKNKGIDTKGKANAELFGRMIVKLNPIKDIFSQKLVAMVGDYTRILPGLASNNISIYTISHLAEFLSPKLEEELEKYYKNL
jgi:high-affinity K+ transport system ATPase subunit B